MTDTLLVRLKPYDPRRGHVLRRYVRRHQVPGGAGWYRVEAVAEYLRACAGSRRSHAPLAFDVCTEAEAKALDAGEQRREGQAQRHRRPEGRARARGTLPTDHRGSPQVAVRRRQGRRRGQQARQARAK